MRYLKYTLLILALFLIVCFLFTAFSRFSPEVIVKPHAEYKETTYSVIDEDGKEISLTTYQTELNKHVLRLRSNSALPLRNQVFMLGKILDRVFEDNNKSEFKTLFAGRLVNAFGEDKTLSERLKAAAKNSSTAGHWNDRFRDIANNAMIYPELREMFKKKGLEIKFSSAEKVLIDPSDNLPYDCLTWFSISD